MFLIFFFKHILYPPAAGRFRLKISAGGSSERKKQKLEPVFFSSARVWSERKKRSLCLPIYIPAKDGQHQNPAEYIIEIKKR